MVVDICRSQYEKYDKIIYPDRPQFANRPDSSSMMANAAKYLYDRYVGLRSYDDNLSKRPILTMEQFLFSEYTAFAWDIGKIVSPNKGIKWWTDADQEKKTRDREYLWSYGTIVGYCKYGSGLSLDTDIGRICIDQWKCAVADIPPAVVAMIRIQLQKNCSLETPSCG